MLNAFRGDVAERSKTVKLIAPVNTAGVHPTIRINNKILSFVDWDAATIAAAINDSEFPELEGLTAIVSGSDVNVTGELNTDFLLTFSARPTAEVENFPGVNPRSQKSRISFNGATAGTYTLTLNGETTGAIAFGDVVDARAKLAALASFAPTDFDVLIEGGALTIDFRGAYATAAVTVSVNGGGLTNPSGSIVLSREVAAVAERYDSYMFAMRHSNSVTVTIDGNSAVVFSDDPTSVVQTKLQALTTGGRVVNVYGGPVATSGIAQPIWILEFSGYGTTTRPTISLSGSLVANGAELQLIYDASAGINATGLTGSDRRNELVMFDLNDGGMNVNIDGAVVEIAQGATAAEIATALNGASRYVEWTGFEAPTFTNGATIGVIPVKHPKIHFVYWSRVDVANDADIPDTYLKKVSGTGFLKVIANGGTNSAGLLFRASRTPATVSGGTFTITIAGSGTTSAIAWNASAATVEAAVAAIASGAVCLDGTGSAGSPWRIRLPATVAFPDLLPTATASFTVAGSATASADRNAFVGSSGSATVTVSTRAISGSYALRFGFEGPIAFAPGLSGAAFKTLLQNFPSLANSADTVVVYDATAGTYQITFASNLANRTVANFSIDPASNLLETAGDETNARVVTLPTGPGNWADPDNWTARRLPETNDDVVIDSATGGILYGLRQFVGVTVDAIGNVFTAIGGHDFLINQRVRLYGADLPSPLLQNTDYFVVSPEYTRGTFSLSATVNGPSIDLLGVGSGSIFVGVRVRTLRILGTFDQQIGLPENNPLGFREYRPRYLKLGIAENCDIGEGGGSGSGLIRIDTGVSGPDARVELSGSSDEVVYPAVNSLADSDELRFAIMEGSGGVAAGDNESAEIGDVGVHGGEAMFGTVTVARDLLKTGGTILSRELKVNGFVREN